MLRLVIILLCVLPIPAFSQAPECGSKSSIDLVMDVFTQSIERQAAGFPQGQRLAAEIMRLVTVKVLSIRTSKVARSSGKRHCEGVLEVRLTPQGAAQMRNNPRGLAMMARDPATRGLRFSGQTLSHDIEITSQLTDDGKEHVVEIVGHRMLAEFVFQLTGPEASERLSGKPANGPDSGAPSMQWDQKANIQAAVQAIVSTYRKSGSAGAIEQVEDCYKAVSRLKGPDAQLKQFEYCAGMDLAAYRLDSNLSKQRGFPQTPFFTSERFIGRLGLLRDHVPDADEGAGLVGRWGELVTGALKQHKIH